MMKVNNPLFPANTWLSKSEVPDIKLADYLADLQAKKKAADIAATLADARKRSDAAIAAAKSFSPTKTKASIVAGYA
jgi:hypothetical protein